MNSPEEKPLFSINVLGGCLVGWRPKEEKGAVYFSFRKSGNEPISIFVQVSGVQ